MSQQMSFDWPTGVALAPEDYFVSEANAQAYAMVTNPESWPDRKLVIIGPAGCGKEPIVSVVYYLDIVNIVQPNPISRVYADPTAQEVDSGETPVPTMSRGIRTISTSSAGVG